MAKNEETICYKMVYYALYLGVLLVIRHKSRWKVRINADKNGLF